jgi:hypothetical protein
MLIEEKITGKNKKNRTNFDGITRKSGMDGMIEFLLDSEKQ